VRFIRVFAKNMGDPYYEPTIVVHDTTEPMVKQPRVYEPQPSAALTTTLRCSKKLQCGILMSFHN